MKSSQHLGLQFGSRGQRQRRSSGHALVETALSVSLLVLIVLNAVNFGYFFFVALNAAAAPRSGAEYSIQGYATPSAATNGALASSSSVSDLTTQDITGDLRSPASAAIRVCSASISCSGGGCPAAGQTRCSDSTNSPADPEPSNFLMQEVDISYTFTPLIPSTVFAIALPCGTSCTFHRRVYMRAMN